MTDLLTHLSSAFCLSLNQIYATGESNGGGFVGGVLACDPNLSVSIRAFAAVGVAWYVADEGVDGGNVDVTKTKTKTKTTWDWRARGRGV